jgi:magnesium chelatase family protein
VVGGGNSIRPGEISMAHRGVLFLDELPEFQRSVLEALRQPLEDHMVTISRATGAYTFPCQFIMLAACNPCPCGFLGSGKTCSCMPGQISRYRKKISGPILDRVDIYLDVPAVEVEKLTTDNLSESSVEIRNRVEKAREIQYRRFKKLGILTNSEMKSAAVKQFCALDTEGLNLLKLAISQMGLSARAYHRVLKLSRTIADLCQSENIKVEHVAESLTYKGEKEI